MTPQERYCTAWAIVVLLGFLLLALYVDRTGINNLNPFSSEECEPYKHGKSFSNQDYAQQVFPSSKSREGGTPRSTTDNSTAYPQNEAADSDYYACRLSIYTKGLAVFTEALVAATVCLFGIGIYQGVQLSRHGVHMESMAVTAISTAKQQLRAYVSDKPAEIRVFSRGGSNKIGIQFVFFNENHGLTPARNVQHSITAGICEHPLPKSFIPKLETDITSRVVIFPRARFIAESEITYYTTEQINPIFEGTRLRLYIFGLVRFDDIYGEAHETHVCVHCGGPKFGEDISRLMGEARTKSKAAAPLEHTYSDQHNYEW